MHSSRMRTTRSSSSLLGGVCLNAMLGYTPRAWAWTPPGVDLETPWPEPPTSPPWVWAWRPPRPDPPNLPPGPGPRHPLPREQNS